MNNPDIVCLSETWLTTEISETELFLNEYNCFRSDCKAKIVQTSHGGTMICVKRSFVSENANFGYDTNGSVVGCYVTSGNLKILVISCYLPPANSKYSLNTEDIHKMFSEILKLRSKCDGLIIYGDFNFPTINWSSISSQNSIEANFLTFIEKFDLIQKIDFQTAATGILDLFFVSENIQVTDICKFQNENSFTKMSNHYPIKTKVHIEISCLYQRKYVKESTLSFCNGDYKLLNDLIIDNPFDTYCWSNPNVIVEHWYKWLLDLLSSTHKHRTP